MGKIFCLMGKSATGKDTIAREILKNSELKSIILFTTRPIRTNEINGRDYYFVSQEELNRLELDGKVIEKRTYKTVHGDWTYATVNENNVFDLDNNSYFILNTLEGYKQLTSYFGQDKVVPIYIWVPFDIRLDRAFSREEQQENPKYKELCRRFIMDEIDFSENILLESGISNEHRYLNDDLALCLEQINKTIYEELTKKKENKKRLVQPTML